MALEQVRRRVQQEGKQQAVGLGELERPLQRPGAGAGVTEGVVGARFEQERLDLPIRSSAAGQCRR